MTKEDSQWDDYQSNELISMKHGFDLYLRPKCEYSRKRFIYKIAESNEIDYLIENWFPFISRHLICLDIGANIGYWSKFLAERLQVKHIYAFEPDPITFEILKKNTIKNHNCSCFQKAVSSSKEDLNLFINPLHSGDNRPLNTEGRKSIKVKSICIDDFVCQQNINQIDFIKIDIQGGEKNAIEGSRKTIKQFKPFLLIEVDQDLSKGLVDFIKSFCKEENYQIMTIKDMRKNDLELNELNDYNGNIFAYPLTAT